MRAARIGWAALLLLSTLAACSSNALDTEPVSLPVPFSGALTADTDVAIAEGSPIAATDARLAGLVSDSASLTWTLFDPSSGVSRGTMTFFTQLSDLQVTPFNGGVRRAYVLRACAALDGAPELCSDAFQCFEYPTDFVSAFGAGVVRVAICSGPREDGGGLITGKFLLGMEDAGGEDFRFLSQEESAIFIQEKPVTSKVGTAEGKVVATLLTNGFSSPVAGGLDNQLELPILLPGKDDPVGVDIKTFTSSNIISPDHMEFVADIQFLLPSSTVFVRNVRMVLDAVPELDDVFIDLASSLSAEPGFTPTFLDGRAFLSTVGEADPVDCDPAKHDATGLFRDLCDRYGSLNLDFRCSILFNPDTFEVFPAEGAWIFSRP